MKTTKKRFFPTVCTVLFCFFSLLPSSQAQIEAGVFTGFSNYQGDLADGAIIWRETQMSYGVLIRYTPNRFWSVRANYIQGQIQASDYNSAQITLRKRGYRFKSTLNEFAAIGEFNFLGKDNNSANDFSFMFNPYLFGGVGVVSTTGTPQAPGDTSPYPFPEPGAQHVFMTVPMGIGFKIQPSPTFSLGLEWGARTVFSDKLDGVTNASYLINSKGNDWYMFGGLIFTYFFNGNN